MKIFVYLFGLNSGTKSKIKTWFYRVLISLIGLVIVISFIQQTDAFSPEVAQFIREGKQLRLKIREEVTNMVIIPAHDIEVKILQDSPDNNIFALYNLKKDQKYYIKTGPTPVKKWNIQVFATKERQQAKNVFSQLEKDGFKLVKLIEENEWFKVKLGPFTVEDKAREIAEKLELEGWDTWLKSREAEETGPVNLNVYHDDGQLVFSGKGMFFQGRVSLDQMLYHGHMEFILLNSEIDIFYSTDIDSVISAMLVSQYDRQYKLADKNMNQINEIKLRHNLLINTDDKNMLPLLRVQAVVNRTFLLKYLATCDEGFLRFNNYPDEVKITSVIQEAVNSTTGQVLQKNELFFDLKINTGKTVNEIYRLNNEIDYQKVLKDIYSGTKLKDLSNEIEEKIILNSPIEKGLRYKEIRQLTWWGPRLITMLDLDLTDSDLKLEPFLSQNKTKGLEDLSEVVIERSALAAINGGYFSYTGRPLGLLMIEGEIISEPIKNRTAIGITTGGKVLIDQIKWQGIFTNNDLSKQIKITGVNRPPRENEVVILNKYFGKTGPVLKPGIREIVVNEGKIQEINEIKYKDSNARTTQIPEEGFLVHLHGDSRKKADHFSVGHQVYYKNLFDPDWENQRVVSALGAGPTIIKNGEINITGEEEGFQNDILKGQAPRSAVGITKDNHLLMVTVDGRQPHISIGISLEELAKFLKKNGVQAAMNLDGGASTRMVVRRFIMNNPSSERLIANGLLIKIAGNH